MNNKELVLSWLEDEESKFIFEKRCEHNATGNFQPIREIVEKYVPELAKYNYSPEKSEEFCKKITDKNIWIWGAGEMYNVIETMMENKNTNIVGVIDISQEKHGNITKFGRKIYNPSDVDFTKIDILVISMAKPKSVDDAVLMAKQNGMNENNIILFNDYFGHYLEDLQYFDSIIKYNDIETFVDAGVLDLSTTLLFGKKSKENGVKTIKSIAFEPDPESFNKCIKIKEQHSDINIELVNSGLFSSNTTLGFNALGNSGSSINDDAMTKVNVVTLDTYTNEKITFIKMDIEGAELEALKGCRETIIKHKPKLAICVYHKPEDIIEIPMYIKSLVPEYKLYLRHYSDKAVETVLYALPY